MAKIASDEAGFLRNDTGGAPLSIDISNHGRSNEYAPS
jgi:hypothetical protein